MKPLKAAFRRGSLPRSYDLRSDGTRGKYISQPIDQGWCGASWAITTAQVTTDRFSIMSKGAINDVLSPQHLLSCNSRNQQGCQGGHLTRAWNWIRKFGWLYYYTRTPFCAGRDEIISVAFVGWKNLISTDYYIKQIVEYRRIQAQHEDTYLQNKLYFSIFFSRKFFRNKWKMENN